MTDEKNTPSESSPAPPPPTIAPKKPVPRPPGPPPAGEAISTEHFALPAIDLESITALPDFADITSSAVAEAPARGSARHGGDRTPSVDSADSHDDARDTDANTDGAAPESSADQHDGPTIGTKVKGWAGSAMDSVKSLGPNPKHDSEDAVDDDAVDDSADSDSDFAETTGTAAAAPGPQTAKQGGPEGEGMSASKAGEGGSDPDPAAAEVPRQAAGGPRKVRLAIARLDPWSVMKLSFLMSVAMGIMLVVATWVFWYALNNLGVFTSIDELISGIVGNESADFDLLQYLARDKVMSAATLIAVVDVVLLTALATIGAFLYNIVAALVGGIHMTMTDD